jgi:hypothetical protein
MVTASKEKQQLLESQRLCASVSDGVVSKSHMEKLFFSSTTRSSFQSPAIAPTKSFSDVHKAAQRVPVSSKRRAPFWSKDMSQYVILVFCSMISSYNQSFIPLPLEGARINRELATTFQPEAGNNSSASRSSSVSAGTYKTRYNEDFSSNVVPGKDYRLAPFRPKVQKHVREDDHLLYAESITHESFRDVSGYHARPTKHSNFSPTINRPIYKLSGSTRYNEDFSLVADTGVPQDEDAIANRSSFTTGSANRVFGPTVPHQIRQYVIENGPQEFQESNLRDVLFTSSPTKTLNSPDKFKHTNPYMAEFLNS